MSFECRVDVFDQTSGAGDHHGIVGLVDRLCEQFQLVLPAGIGRQFAQSQQPFFRARVGAQTGALHGDRPAIAQAPDIVARDARAIGRDARPAGATQIGQRFERSADAAARQVRQAKG